MALLLAGTMTLVGGSGFARPSGQTELPPPETIVLVTIDTLRADHVGAYGYWLETTPFLDRLAAQGARFERAMAHSGTTQPSHASMFTGLYPLQHGVLRNGQRLAEEFVTVAELAGQLGYRTAGFVSTDAHFEWGGQLQGFDVRSERREGVDERLYRSGRRTVDAVVDWLDGTPGDAPLFLWVHLFDPHRPFRPPPESMLQVGYRGRAARRRHVQRLQRRHRLDIGFAEPLVERIERYDAEIAHADAQLGRLFDALRARGRDERAVWIVTADHGQGLGNHGWFGHSKQIYNEQLRVPLIFWSDDSRFGAGAVVPRLVELVDLAPTIVEIAGGDAGMLDPRRVGSSLLPLLGQPGEYSKGFALAQRSFYPTSRRQQNEELVQGRNFALQDERWKYLWFEAGPDELYDLAADPYETRSVIARHPDVARRMRGRIEDMVERLDTGVEGAEVSAEALERLRALGYIQ